MVTLNFFCQDYGNTFSAVAKSTIICPFSCHGCDPPLVFSSLNNIKRAFLHGELYEVYMDQPLHFIVSNYLSLVCSLQLLEAISCTWFSHLSLVLLEFSMTRSEANQLVFSTLFSILYVHLFCGIL